jgi:hypothetical protein
MLTTADPNRPNPRAAMKTSAHLGTTLLTVDSFTVI